MQVDLGTLGLVLGGLEPLVGYLFWLAGRLIWLVIHLGLVEVLHLSGIGVGTTHVEVVDYVLLDVLLDGDVLAVALVNSADPSFVRAWCLVVNVVRGVRGYSYGVSI